MDATDRNGRLAARLTDELAAAGVVLAVISPGSRSTPVALALHREPRIPTVVVLDERSAAFVALGAALASGKPAVVACTSGSAAANLHPAMLEADQAEVPLIALTSDRPPELRDIGAGQTIDQLKLFGAAVRWFCEVGTHEDDDAGLGHLAAVGARAAAVAAGDPRPGPVHLNLSWREPLVSPTPPTGDRLAGDSDARRPRTAVRGTSRAPDEEAIGAIADRIAGVDRGLIVAGRATEAGLGAALAALSDATGFPILAEPTSQARCGAHAEGRVVSTYDHLARALPEALRPELVLRFGDFPTSKPLRLLAAAGGGPEQIAFECGYGWRDPSRSVTEIVRGRLSAIAEGLAGHGGRGAGEWRARWLAADAAVAAAIEAEIRESTGLSEPAVHRALAGLYADGDLVYTASSMPIRDQEAFLPASSTAPIFHANRGVNGIDGLLSSAAGAALATDRPVWVVIGDLGLIYDAAGLTAIRAAPQPVRVLVLNNGGGGIFELLPQAEALEREEFEALFATAQRVEIGALARAHGIEHRIPGSIEELPALRDSGTLVAEVTLDRRADAALRRRIAARAAAAIASPA